MIVLLFLLSFLFEFANSSGCDLLPGCGNYIAAGTLFVSTVYPNNVTSIRSALPRISSGCQCDSSCMVYGDCCSNYVSLCRLPQISNVNPSSGPTLSVSVMTLSGINFMPSDTAPVVTVGGSNCPVVSFSDTQVFCNIPPGTGSVAITQLITTGTSIVSNSIIYSYNAPIVSAVIPSSKSTIGTFHLMIYFYFIGSVLTILGSNFGDLFNFVVINWGTTSIVASSMPTAHSAVTFNAPASVGSSVTLSVTVNGQQSNVFTLPISGPSITDVNPIFGSTSGAMNVTITGLLQFLIFLFNDRCKFWYKSNCYIWRIYCYCFVY